MKDKQNKHLKIAAQKIVKAEKELLLGKNVQENQQKIENINYCMLINYYLLRNSN